MLCILPITDAAEDALYKCISLMNIPDFLHSETIHLFIKLHYFHARVNIKHHSYTWAQYKERGENNILPKASMLKNRNRAPLSDHASGLY